MSVYSPKYYDGNINILDTSQSRLSIVGSRSILDQTKLVLENLFDEIKNFNICIVSGGMYGVDICAHNLALLNDMKTIFVLPQGISSYKKSSLNRQLRFKENSEYLYISDYPDNFSPRKYTFLERNKIISIVSDVTLVAQASIKSGSLSTAFSALRNFKKVIAVPISLHNPQFQGTNYLIGRGCVIYLNPDTVLSHLGINHLNFDRRILEIIKDGPITISELVNKLDLRLSLVQKSLLKLILEGEVSFDGTKYRYDL